MKGAGSAHIADFSQAVADGTLPGRFTPDRTVYEFPAVETLNARGGRHVWRIRVRLLAGPSGPPLPISPSLLAPGAAAPPQAVGEISTESHQVTAAGVRGKTSRAGRPTLILAGKNLGQANATNVVTQALREALSRYRAQMQKGAGGGTAAEAAAGAPTAGASGGIHTPEPLRVHPPMLVKKLGETRSADLTPEDFERGVILQRKYNGVRAVAYLEPGGKVDLYSRKRVSFRGFTHIRAELEKLLATPPPVPAELLAPLPHCRQKEDERVEGEDGEAGERRGGGGGEGGAAALRRLYAAATVHLDGELYQHGQCLRWISGQARREADEASLDYVVFDCFFPGPKAAGHDMPSENRQKYLDLLFSERGRAERCRRAVQRAESFPVASLEEAEALRDRFLGEGYEGAIARKACQGYRYSYNGYHSANVLKLKPTYDSEFTVVGYTQGTKGKDVGAVIWICEVEPERQVGGAAGEQASFHVVPKDMTYEERYRIHRCLGEEVDDDRAGAAPGAKTTRFDRDFRGRPLTVEYPERSTKTGKPTQAKALAFRTYDESGPESDPIRRLYAECGEAAGR